MDKIKNALPGDKRKRPMAKQDSGIYFLLIKIGNSISIGTKSKTFNIPKGFYVYVGSAQKNLSCRLKRHLAKTKKMHWHIDYLLARGKNVNVITLPGAAKEKEAKSALKLNNAADWSVTGFGSTDSSAPSHLFGFSSMKKILKAIREFDNAHG